MSDWFKSATLECLRMKLRKLCWSWWVMIPLARFDLRNEELVAPSASNSSDGVTGNVFCLIALKSKDVCCRGTIRVVAVNRRVCHWLRETSQSHKWWIFSGNCLHRGQRLLWFSYFFHVVTKEFTGRVWLWTLIRKALSQNLEESRASIHSNCIEAFTN